jgi:hypothetical protein
MTALLALLLTSAGVAIVVFIVAVLILAFIIRDQRHHNSELGLENQRLKRDIRDATLQILTLKSRARQHGNPLEHLRNLLEEVREGTAIPVPALCVCGDKCSYRLDADAQCPAGCPFCASLAAGQSASDREK